MIATSKNGRPTYEPASPLAGLLGAPLLLLLGAAACFLELQRPEPVPRRTPGEFSAEHAIADLGLIAQEPRPVGSEHHARVRRWLTTEIRTMGLVPTLQAGSVDGTSLANVLVRFKGQDSTGAVLLACHYDSRPETPGASDDGVSVIALLRLLDHLPREGPLRNDLIFLFSDGEELGLLGARLFAAEHPWFADVACVVNLEAIGNDGPFVMFQTGPGSGELVRRYAAVAPHPVTTSLAPAVYDRLPNDTDFTVFRAAGLPGLNFAIVGGGSAYHAPHDTTRAIDPGTVQHLGATVLALARELGNADLAALERTDLTYFDLWGRWFVAYDAGASAALGAGALLALVVALLLAGRSQGPGWGARLLGPIAFAVLAVLVSATLWGFWRALEALVAAYFTPASVERVSDFESSNWTLAGLALLAVTAIVSTAEFLRRGQNGEARARALGLGGLLLWAPILAALHVLDPHAGAQVTVGVALAALGACAGGRNPVLPGLAAVLAVPLVAPVVCLAFHLMTTQPWKAALVGAVLLPLVAGLAAPYLVRVRHGRATRTLLALGGAGMLVAGAWLRANGS